MLELRDIITLKSVTDKNVRFSDDKRIGKSAHLRKKTDVRTC